MQQVNSSSGIQMISPFKCYCKLLKSCVEDNSYLVFFFKSSCFADNFYNHIVTWKKENAFVILDNCQNNSKFLISRGLLRKKHTFTTLFPCLTGSWLIMPTSDFLQHFHSYFHAFFSPWICHLWIDLSSYSHQPCFNWASLKGQLL